MTRYLIAATLCLSIYAAWLTGFTSNHLKDRFCASSYFEDDSGEPEKQVDDGKLAHAPALPPKTSMAALKNVWPTHGQDGLTIAQILEGN